MSGNFCNGRSDGEAEKAEPGAQAVEAGLEGSRFVHSESESLLAPDDVLPGLMTRGEGLRDGLAIVARGGETDGGEGELSLAKKLLNGALVGIVGGHWVVCRKESPIARRRCGRPSVVKRGSQFAAGTDVMWITALAVLTTAEGGD